GGALVAATKKVSYHGMPLNILWRYLVLTAWYGWLPGATQMEVPPDGDDDRVCERSAAAPPGVGPGSSWCSYAPGGYLCWRPDRPPGLLPRRVCGAPALAR